MEVGELWKAQGGCGEKEIGPQIPTQGEAEPRPSERSLHPRVIKTGGAPKQGGRGDKELGALTGGTGLSAEAFWEAAPVSGACVLVLCHPQMMVTCGGNCCHPGHLRTLAAPPREPHGSCPSLGTCLRLRTPRDSPVPSSGAATPAFSGPSPTLSHHLVFQNPLGAGGGMGVCARAIRDPVLGRQAGVPGLALLGAPGRPWAQPRTMLVLGYQPPRPGSRVQRFCFHG